MVKVIVIKIICPDPSAANSAVTVILHQHVIINLVVADIVLIILWTEDVAEASVTTASVLNRALCPSDPLPLLQPKRLTAASESESNSSAWFLSCSVIPGIQATSCCPVF